MLVIDAKRCVRCGNCDIYLGDDIMKRFKKNVLELTKEELEHLRGKIDNALDECHLDALRLV